MSIATAVPELLSNVVGVAVVDAADQPRVRAVGGGVDVVRDHAHARDERVVRRCVQQRRRRGVDRREISGGGAGLIEVQRVAARERQAALHVA